MKPISGVCVMILYLVCSKRWSGDCIVDIVVNIKDREPSEYYTLEELGPSYGSLPTLMYKMNQGYHCDRVIQAYKIIWEAMGPERAMQILVSGHGGARKRVEIQLNTGLTLFFEKDRAWQDWRRFFPRQLNEW